MKILQLGKFYPVRGGVEKVMYDLTLGLSAERVHCDMLCASTESFPAGTFKLNDFADLIVVPTKLKLAATMLAPAMISWLRKRARYYDIVHIHHPDPMACFALFLSGYKGKVVLHWHSDILKQKALLKIYAPFQRWLIDRSDLIVGTSPVYVKESPFLQKVQYKTDFIPIGVEPMKLDGSKAKALRIKYAGRKLIFSLGRLVEYKGYQYLIKAASMLDDTYKLIIGGTGPMRADLENLIDHYKVRDRVELIGFVEDSELPAYFQACDLFCLSSILKTEAFAIVQIEAMSCSKPVISTTIPGSGVSWVNANAVSGLTVTPRDAAALATAIKEVFKDSEAYAWFARGSRHRYETLFTRKRMIDKSLRLYTNVLNR